MEMKNMVLVYVNPGLFGAIDYSTILNLDKAMQSLERDRCDAVYIALNHLDNEKQRVANKYIKETFISGASAKSRNNAHISDWNGHYALKFVEYVSMFQVESVNLGIFANYYCRETIRQEIDDAREAMRETGLKVPLFYTR